MPATAAVVQPMAQASIADRCGRAPLSMASDRSSTAARMASPGRDPWSSTRRPAASATAAASAARSCQVRLTPSTDTCSLPQNRVSGRATSGGHTHSPSPSSAASRPMLTTTRAVSGASCSSRITSRSMATPSSGAATPSTAIRASGADHPHPNRACQ